MGAVGGSVKIGIGFLLFVAGYSFCRYVNNDERYSIFRRNSEPFLYDHREGKSLLINEKEFQLGTLEYRLEGILRDRHLSQVLNKLSADKDE